MLFPSPLGVSYLLMELFNAKSSSNPFPSPLGVSYLLIKIYQPENFANKFPSPLGVSYLLIENKVLIDGYIRYCFRPLLGFIIY